MSVNSRHASVGMKKQLGGEVGDATEAQCAAGGRMKSILWVVERFWIDSAALVKGRSNGLAVMGHVVSGPSRSTIGRAFAVKERDDESGRRGSSGQWSERKG